MNVNERLRDAAIHHSIDFSQYSASVAQRLIAVLNRADAELFARLLIALEQVDATTFTVERLEQLLYSVRTVNAQAYAVLGRELTDELKQVSDYEAGYQFRLFTSTMPEVVIAKVGVASVNVDQVYAAALARPFQGRLLSGWASKIEADRMALIREAVRQGFVQGETNEAIVRRIRGTRALRYEDGIVNRSRREVQTIVQTAVAHTAAVAREQFFEANSDLITAEVWTSTLDGRTSEMCRIRDRLKYTLKDHKPIGHAVPWLQGPGRLHFRCRSCATPQTKTFRQLGIPIDEVPAGQRASMDGPVDAGLSYGEWLQKQSAARQDQIVGPARGKLMREGKMKFDELYTDRGILLTLEELKARDAAAFKKAGI